MEVRRAQTDDVATYAALGRVAQSRLQSRGLQQYVPAAHDEYQDAIWSRVGSGTLYAVWSDGAAIAFFTLDPMPSPWWPTDGVAAFYLGGMVVAEELRGRNVGGAVIQWCVGEAVRCGCHFVRLDCHAGNQWLCDYYESHGFILQGRVEQHPGYDGCLYQRPV